MVVESGGSHITRNAWFEISGKKVFHAYKGRNLMTYWFGLSAKDNKESSPNLVDIRRLPAVYQVDGDIFSTFGNAIADGYDFQAHIRRENANTGA